MTSTPDDEPTEPMIRPTVPTEPDPQSGMFARAIGPELPEPGEMLGEYRVEGVLGAGSSASVLQVIRDGTAFALKLLKHPLEEDDPRWQRFAREIYIGQTLDHPALVTVHDSGAWDQRPYLVMDLLQGETLRQRLTRTPVLPENEVASILAPLVDALDQAHAIAVIHRDFKPENIFLTDEPAAARLLDFGLVRYAEAHTVTNDGEALGTPVYMAPEQIVETRSAGARADQYAVATVAYEMLVGDVPFHAKNFRQLLFVKQSPPEMPASMPEAWGRAIRRALSPKPDERFASVGEFFAAARG